MSTTHVERRLAVPPRPRRAGTLVTALVVVVVVVFLHGLAIHQTGFSVSEFVHGFPGIWDFLFGDPKTHTPGALPPDHSWVTIKQGLIDCVVTFGMGLLGTTFSIPIALILALLGSRTTSRNVVVYQVARGLMSFFRAIPSFIWALIFVNAVGLGSFAGVLAILVHNMGVMGKLWSETMEETDQGPIEALRSAGASSAQTATHAVLPAVLPQFTSLYLYRLDVNVRDALVMGLVGAGGIGFDMVNFMESFEFPSMMTDLFIVLVMIILIDLLSAWLRKRVTA